MCLLKKVVAAVVLFLATCVALVTLGLAILILAIAIWESPLTVMTVVALLLGVPMTITWALDVFGVD